jgi:hypothetical protein
MPDRRQAQTLPGRGKANVDKIFAHSILERHPLLATPLFNSN